MLHEWLRDYRQIEDDISYLEFELDRYKKELKRWVSGDLKNVKLQHDSLGSRVEDNIEKVKKDLAFKRKQKNDLIKLVRKFNGLENKILIMKYIDGMTLETISEELHYSPSYIYKKHTEIIKRIKLAEQLNTS